MIVVSGANGKLGKEIATQLLSRLPASQIGVSVRDPEQADSFSQRGVRVRRADFADIDSLRSSFEGAAQVLIVSSNSTGQDAVQLHRNAIEAAKSAGARRILYTSHVGQNKVSAFPPMRDHAATEEILQNSGLPFMSLRNGFYADSAFMLLGQALETGKLIAPEDGPVSWTCHADLAEATAILLVGDGHLESGTQLLTNVETWDLVDIAAIASELTGRQITRVTVSDQEFQDSMASRGIPAATMDMMLGMFIASRQGQFGMVDGSLELLLGRRPMSMRQFLVDRLSS